MRFIAKQASCQKYIFKIHSSRLRENKWKLSLQLDEARRNEELISLADSQVLRWIDELNGITDADAKAREIKAKIRQIKREENTALNKRAIRQLYKDLDALQFKPDYMCLIIDRKKDYHRACSGFSINGVRYRRLLGTNGGIKNSTIVFVSERLFPELRKRIENGRDPKKKLVAAKLEAYKALACSASIPVSMPKGILVVRDFETVFHEDVIYLSDDGGPDDEPKMEYKENAEITLDGCDGCGLILPSLAERWSAELGLDYVMSGANTRLSFEKGMVFTFDFLDFAENVAHCYTVRDAWGKEHDIRDIELIFTTGMLKLWDSYDGIDSYLACCAQNHYTLNITKVCPKELENERTLNYQFIQSYQLDERDIDELISPTIEDIRDALGEDWRKTIVYLKGSGLNERNIAYTPDDFIKAAMIDPRILDDPFVQSSIYQMIHTRINKAKVGVVKVHGNYSIVSGDPYALCQHIFGLPVTGLLKAGEVYSGYWADTGAEELVSFRAPMSVHNNIRKVRPCRSDEVLYWYRFNKTGAIYNVWDSMTAAMNGMDSDGDLIMLTDNNVLVRKHRATPTIMCLQKTAVKIVPEEDDFVRANVAAFGNDIGQITNWVTSMYEVQSHFPVDSPEYRELDYRVKVGQLKQQDTIDRAKGIVAKPMTKSWHDLHEANRIRDAEKREFYKRIVADRKPYFMRYIYPQLMRQYNTYIKNTDKNAMREFRKTVAELEDAEVSGEKLEDAQANFLRYYRARMPVGTGDCVMNAICRRFEKEFDGYVGRHNASRPFDYRIMRSDEEYLPRQYQAVKRLLDDYSKKRMNYKVFAEYERVDEYDSFAVLSGIDEEFRRECDIICPNERALCNIVLDLCYARNSTRQFAWSMCGRQIIRNLLENNGNVISYPTLSEAGEFEYGGNRFTIETRIIEVEE